jgi:hypothetical protein
MLITVLQYISYNKLCQQHQHIYTRHQFRILHQLFPHLLNLKLREHDYTERTNLGSSLAFLRLSCLLFLLKRHLTLFISFYI